MLENPWSAVGNPTFALCPSGLTPVGIHHLLLSNLTTDHHHHQFYFQAARRIKQDRQTNIQSNDRKNVKKRIEIKKTQTENSDLFTAKQIINITIKMNLCGRLPGRKFPSSWPPMLMQMYITLYKLYRNRETLYS